MTHSAIDDWKSEAEETRNQLRSRFPDFRCVRCGKDDFLMRVWHDQTLDPAFDDDRIVELICESRGFIERHAAVGLAGKLGPIKDKIKAGSG